MDKKKMLQYNPIDQIRFVNYFDKPKRSRGRPRKKRKRKNGRSARRQTKRQVTDETRKAETAARREKIFCGQTWKESLVSNAHASNHALTGTHQAGRSSVKESQNPGATKMVCFGRVSRSKGFAVVWESMKERCDDY